MPFRVFGFSRQLSPFVPTLCLAAILASSDCCGQSLDAPSGIAWAVQGRWRDVASGQSLGAGSFVHPGALLKPQDPNSPNSITVLLPDGQRILNECFTAIDCNRGFRVPSLTERPSAFQTQLLARIGEVLAHENGRSGQSSAALANAAPPRLDEAVARMVPQTGSGASPAAFSVTWTGAAAALPEGNYTFDLRRVADNSPVALQVPWSKNSAGAVFPIPSPGIYEITVRDTAGTPRIDLILAAIAPTRPDLSPNLLRAKTTLQAWDDRNYGWPVHMLLRAYLQSLYDSGRTP